MHNIRQEKIRQYIESKNIVTIRELQELFPQVSLMTIHRDLNMLEANGCVVKFRGGAKSVRYEGDTEINVRMRENNAGKDLIAQKALKLIQPHTSVFLDAGTSTLSLAKHLPDMDLNVVTTGPNVAIELCRLRGPVVTLCGGVVNRKSLAISGKTTLEMLEGINIDTAFIGVSGCSVEAGFTCGTESDMLVKQFLIRKARTSVLMCTAEKLKCLMPYTFASFRDADYLICDKPLPPEFLHAAREAGLRIL